MCCEGLGVLFVQEDDDKWLGRSYYFFLVVGDAKYSAKIEMIGAALIDEGICCVRARQST